VKKAHDYVISDAKEIYVESEKKRAVIMGNLKFA
jgi:hypothetical protein